MPIIVDKLYAGTLAPLGSHSVASGIMKRSVPGPWRITRDGLLGDWQGDTRHHGGPEKALHHYAHEHYLSWIKEEPSLGALLASPPAFGENISTTGITEETVCIGDVYRAGAVLLQVSQGRQPCWRLNARFGRADMALRVQITGRTGWYYRILREGRIEPGSEFVLVDRPRPEWPLARVISLLYLRTLDIHPLAILAELPELASSWRELASRRVVTNAVESWDRRLFG